MTKSGRNYEDEKPPTDPKQLLDWFEHTHADAHEKYDASDFKKEEEEKEK